jgi:hypothetical protein
MQTHQFTLVAIETAGTWDRQESEFIKELGRRITECTGEELETQYIFQQISVAVHQRGNMMAVTGTFPPDEQFLVLPLQATLIHFNNLFLWPAGFVLAGI